MDFSTYICPMTQRTNTDRSIQHRLDIAEMQERAIAARKGFLRLGTTSYVPFVEAQATREGIHLSQDAKIQIRQVLNGNVRPGDAELLDLIERALSAQQAA